VFRNLKIQFTLLPNKIAVIGLGNTLRRDDGIGIVILNSLLSFYKRESVDYFNFGIASFDLLHRLGEYEKVLLIDAIDAGFQPGELKIFALDEVEYKLKTPITSAHEFSLKEIFGLYKELGLKTEVYIAGIQVKDVDFGEGVTEGLAKKKDKLAKEISDFIDAKLIAKKAC